MARQVIDANNNIVVVENTTAIETQSSTEETVIDPILVEAQETNETGDK
jgi:hypothetical protein